MLIIVLLAVTALCTFLILKYKAEVIKQNENQKIEVQTVLFPYVNTFEFLPTKVGEKYQSEVFASLQGSHESLEIKASGLPEGLVLDNCTQSNDASSLPIPNTVTKCIIEGIPLKEGEYKVVLTAGTTGEFNVAQSSLTLTIGE